MNHRLFLWLVLIYAMSLTVSNLIAGKLWQVTPTITLTAGALLFPVVYILDDVIPECYGIQVARQVIWLGFAANLFAVVFFTLTLALPYPSYFGGQSAFEVVLGFTPRLLLASFTAYLVGTHANAYVLVWIKRLTNSRFLWIRTIGSTLVGESLDSTIFMLLAFWGVVPNAALPTMILSQATFKIAYEVLATPLTYIVVGQVKQSLIGSTGRPISERVEP